MKKAVKSICVNKNLIKTIVSVILVLFCSIQPFNAEASENNKEALNVGWYNWELPKDKFVDEAYQNYIKEYCKRIEEVTGLKLNYLGEKSFNNKNIFEDVETDFIFGVPYSVEVAKKYAYIDSPVFKARFSIYRVRNKDEVLENVRETNERAILNKDYDRCIGIKNKKIAIVTSSKKSVLKMIEAKTGVKLNSSNLVKYTTLKEAQNAVLNKKADYLFCLSIFTDMNKFKEVCPILEKNTYLLTKHENELLIKKLTYALEVIKNENSYYNTWLFKKVKITDDNEICFTIEEKKARNSIDKLVFYVNKDQSIYYNKDKNGIETGYYAKYIKNIATRLHKDYEIIQVDPLKLSNEKRPGLYCDVVRNYKLANKLFGSSNLTKPTLNTEVLLCVDRNNSKIKPGMVYAGTISSLLETVPSNERKRIITKNSFEALDLLIEHKADVALVSGVLTNYVNGLTKNKNIVIANVKPKVTKAMLAINGIDLDLLSAINKVIYFITDDDMNFYIEQENELHRYIPTLFEQISLNFNEFLISAFFVFAVIIYIVRRLINNNLEIANLTNKLKEENNIKDKFLSRISHDIRNPLNGVINYAKFGIEENKRESISYEYFEKISINAEYLLNFMKKILELQRINNKIEIQKHVIEFSDFEKEIKNEFLDLAKEKNIEFEISTKCEQESCYIKTNFKMIKQILFTLLENSFKHTPSGGKIYLSLETYLKDSAILQKYTVSDNGVGMSQEFQKKMYEYFNVEDETLSTEFKNGLGLTICKKTVEKLGGSIECESSLGVGTTFVVIIKEEKPKKIEIKEYLARKKNQKNLKKPRKKVENWDKLKILVCEDSLINAKIMKKILEAANYDCDWVENGQVGVDRVKNTEYDLILMDFKMPIMNGFEASREIRKFNKFIPIIGLSALATEDYEKAIKFGMNECVEKPIDKNKLLKVIEEFTN